MHGSGLSWARSVLATPPESIGSLCVYDTAAKGDPSLCQQCPPTDAAPTPFVYLPHFYRYLSRMQGEHKPRPSRSASCAEMFTSSDVHPLVTRYCGKMESSTLEVAFWHPSARYAIFTRACAWLNVKHPCALWSTSGSMTWLVHIAERLQPCNNRRCLCIFSISLGVPDTIPTHPRHKSCYKQFRGRTLQMLRGYTCPTIGGLADPGLTRKYGAQGRCLPLMT